MTAIYFTRDRDALFALSIFALTSAYLRALANDHLRMKLAISSLTLFSCNFLFCSANSALETLASI